MFVCAFVYFNIRSIRNFDFHTCAFEEFGKDFPKSVKLSPDGFFQSALLLAYYK